MVCLVGMGAVMPEVLTAASELEQHGMACDVICLTSADLVFRAVQARRGLANWPTDLLEVLFPLGRAAPIVAVLDGHPHTLSFLGSISSVSYTHLDVYKRQPLLRSRSITRLRFWTSLTRIQARASGSPATVKMACTCLLYTSRCV